MLDRFTTPAGIYLGLFALACLGMHVVMALGRGL